MSILKFIQKIIFLMLIVTNSYAQTYNQVTAFNNYQVINGDTITVSSLGAGTINSSACSIGPYNIIAVTNLVEGIKLNFSNSVWAIRIKFVSLEAGDTISVFINGIKYMITTANLSGFSMNTLYCNISSTIVAFVSNGSIIGTFNGGYHGLQLDINPGINIDSVQVSETHTSGIFFSFFFASGCGATPIMHADTPCVGDSLHLGVQIPGTTITYNWSGPNGFSSTAQNPVKPNVTFSDSGMYYVSISADSCTYYDSSRVHVNPYPMATITTNTNYCTGDTLYLNATSPYSASWYWHGPNNFSDTLSNTHRNNLQFPDSGFYKVTATIGNCSSSDSVFVHVKPVPLLPIVVSNSPLCVGDTLKLNISNIQSGVSYQWRGPLGFNSTIANATRANMQLNDAGNYILKDTLNACAGKTDTVQVVVQANTTPTVTISAVPTNFTAGQNVSFTASPSYCNNPIYQWYLNGTLISGATSNHYNTTLNAGDQISLSIHCNGQCQTTDSARSNTLTTVGITNLSTNNILIYPNPIVNELLLEGVDINSVNVYDLLGHTIYKSELGNNQIKINTSSWVQGTYLVNIRLLNGIREIRKIIKL